MRQRLAGKNGGLSAPEPRTSMSTLRRNDFQQETNSKEERVYRGWLNWKLSSATPPISVRSLQNDLSDGVVLVLLAQVLYGKTLKFNKRAVLVPQKLDNVNVALIEFQRQGLAHSADAKGFVEGDLRIILGFLWMLIQHEQQKQRSAEDASAGRDLKHDIYSWVNDYIKGYEGVPKDIRSVGPQAFSDGRVLNFMVHRANPSAVDLDAMEMQDARARLLEALKHAKMDLGVPNLITADTLLETKPHEPSLLTYLFAFRQTVEAANKGSSSGSRSKPKAKGKGKGKTRKKSSTRPSKPRKSEQRGKFSTVRAPKDKQRAGFETIRAGPEHAGMTCSICNQRLSGELVKVLPQGTLYHNKCFHCATCQESFERYFWPYQNRPYCFTHYLDAAKMICAACNNQIREGAVVARGRKFHSSCWSCTTCNQPFTDSFYMFEGKPYCKPHYTEVAGSSCNGCGLEINDAAVKALNAHWHRECFSCAHCGVAILPPGGAPPLPFFAQEGSPVCLDCHDASMAYAADTCPKCGKVPTSDIVSALNSKWHASCFVCTGCNDQFSSAFFNVDDSPYCEKCARKLN